ncbi:MAG: gliding motility-associated C-terminal domain-containing protein [Bacteroidales bacterium]|nr:gliding motility-associated C-terminal domain-containing protein [Bacteroidales bacterium]
MKKQRDDNGSRAGSALLGLARRAGKRGSLRCCVSLFMLMISWCVGAQTVVMPAVGTGDTTMSYALVYDDGGPNGPHSSYCNATYTFHTTNPAGRYRVTVNSQLAHSQGNACLTVYDGPMQGVLGQYHSSPTTSVTYSFMNSVTLVFTADDDYPTAGFEVELCEYDGVQLSNVGYETLDSNTLRFSWDDWDTSVVWHFDYAIFPDSLAPNPETFFDTGTYTSLILFSPYTVIGNIPWGWVVVYRLTSGDMTGCAPQWASVARPTITLECPCVIPSWIQVTALQDSVLLQWTGTATTMWHLWDPWMGFDTVLPPSATSLTIPYDFPCDAHAVNINGDCQEACDLIAFHLPMGGCHQSVASINKLDATSHSITLGWNGVPDSGARYLLYYRPVGSQMNYILVDTLPYDSLSYTVEGLLPYTRYSFMLWVICSNGDLSCDFKTANYYTTLDNCIDFVNIYDNPSIQFAFGSYDNPGQFVSVLQGRHTPIVDTSLRDANTGFALRCVPPGEEVSLRLGDDNGMAQAEMVTYDYQVDSNINDMLVLRYAVVMQNPNHTAENQPHFTMEILDETGVPIDTTCCYADFYAAGSLGWNTVSGTNVIWRDWTTVGIDIAPYHGQNIKIRFTTKDCADGGHFGYAYFTIHCDRKHIDLVNICDHYDSVRLRAPLGFEYAWTHGEDTTVISTDNEIVVPADSTIYHCRASFIGKPECNFTINSIAIIPKLIVAIGYDIDTCANTLLLTNRSEIQIDSAWSKYVTQTIETVIWYVNDDTLYGNQVSVQLNENQLYIIVLSCALSGSLCVDSATVELDVDFVTNSAILGDTLVCPGEMVPLTASVQMSSYGADMMWDDSTTTAQRIVTVNSDTAFMLIVNHLHCSDTLLHHINLLPVYDDTIVAVYCAGDTQLVDYSQFNISTTTSGVYTLHLLTQQQCDSVVTLDLTIHSVYSDTLFVSTCDEGYTDSEFAVDTTGFYTHAYQTQDGCDSLLNLSFVRHALFNDTIDAQILLGDTYDNYGFVENTTGFYTLTYIDQNGCDSSYALDLYVVFLQFPNLVTPNDDGYNDRFVIVNLLKAQLFESTSLWVYDRWGKLIYRKDNIRSQEDFWDPNATHSPDGTYFFRFFARSLDHEVNHQGVVEVRR